MRGVIRGVAVVGCAICLLSVTGCSTLKGVAAFLKFWDRTKVSAEDRAYASFSGKARPILQGNPESHYNLARYYQDRDKNREAIAEFEKVLAIDPMHVKALNAMGVSYDKIDRFDRAAECYRAALKIDPNAAYVYNNLGQSYLLKGDYPSAVDAFRKALDLDERNVRIHNNLGRAYAMAGQRDLAAKELGQTMTMARAEQVIDESLRQAARPETVNDGLKSIIKESLTAKLDDDARAFATRVASFLQERETDRVAVAKADDFSKTTDIVTTGSVLANAANAGDIEICNGNGVKGMAQDMRQYLNKRGFGVTRVTNAKGFQVPRTCVYYTKDHRNTAEELMKQIPGIQTATLVAGFDVSRIKVKVVLGKDLAPRRDVFVEARG